MRHKYLSYTMALILQALDNGYRYGFEVMQVTGLASGTGNLSPRKLRQGWYIKPGQRLEWKTELLLIVLGRGNPTPRGNNLPLTKEPFAAWDRI